MKSSSSTYSCPFYNKDKEGKHGDMNNNLDEITMRCYVDIRFNELVNLFETKIAANEKAVDLASKTLSARLDLMNEFRSQLKDQSLTFFTRNEHQAYLEKTDADIRMLRESRAQLEGKASQKAVTLSLIIAVFGIVLAVASFMHSFTEKPLSYTPSIFQPVK